MTLRLREHPLAWDELRKTATWYDEEPGLGDRFLDAIDDALNQILNWPLSAPLFPGWESLPLVRSMRVSVFPYRVIYYIADTEIVVLAYSHQKRHPWYWHHRFDD